MSKKDEVIRGLKPLFAEARKTGKWFYSAYQCLWFSPDELEKNQRDGRFLWGAVNWQLRKPEEELLRYKNTIRMLQAEMDSFKKRMYK
jgi:hypothetical protein